MSCIILGNNNTKNIVYLFPDTDFNSQLLILIVASINILINVKSWDWLACYYPSSSLVIAWWLIFWFSLPGLIFFFGQGISIEWVADTPLLYSMFQIMTASFLAVALTAAALL